MNLVFLLPFPLRRNLECVEKPEIELSNAFSRKEAVVDKSKVVQLFLVA